MQDIKEITRDIWGAPSPQFTVDQFPDLSGRVYIVTGGSSGIGLEVAKLLLSRSATVYITGRTPSKIKAAECEFRQLYPAAKFGVLDMQNENLSTIRPAVESFLTKEDRLDGIVHNAGINYRGQNIVEDTGCLDIITINVLAPHLLQKLLDPVLERTAKMSPPNEVRVVWVSSAIHYYSPPHGGIDWDSMNEFDAGSFLGSGNGMYGQTKAMNIYEAVQWTRRNPESGVVVTIVHPGTVVSDIRRGNRWRKFVMELWAQPSQYGAYAELWPLLHPSVTSKDNGTYYVPFGVRGKVRQDVREASEGPRGAKYWSWAESITAKY